MKKALMYSWALLLASISASAQDRIFTYTYQSQVLSPEQQEIEVWNTVRWGREQYFRALNQRVEFETGIAQNLQTAFYLNLQSTTAVTSAGQTVIETAFSNEWKYKLLDPVADPAGLSLYGEFTISSTAIEVEPRLILDKVLGPTILALNIAGEFESEWKISPAGKSETEHSVEIHVNAAAGFRLAEGWHAGVELFSRNALEDGSLRFSALYAGPTISYASGRCWANLTFMPQLTAMKGATASGLVLVDAERYQMRVMISYAL